LSYFCCMYFPKTAISKSAKVRPIWGRCYDHNFLRFFLIFSEKIGVFLKYQCYDQFFQNLALFWVKNANFFAKFFGENILKIITSVPGHTVLHGCPTLELKQVSMDARAIHSRLCCCSQGFAIKEILETCIQTISEEGSNTNYYLNTAHGIFSKWGENAIEKNVQSIMCVHKMFICMIHLHVC
jgi:hypothetical protein